MAMQILTLENNKRSKDIDKFYIKFVLNPEDLPKGDSIKINIEFPLIDTIHKEIILKEIDKSLSLVRILGEVLKEEDAIVFIKSYLKLLEEYPEIVDIDSYVVSILIILITFVSNSKELLISLKKIIKDMTFYKSFRYMEDLNYSYKKIVLDRLSSVFGYQFTFEEKKLHLESLLEFYRQDIRNRYSLVSIPYMCSLLHPTGIENDEFRELIVDNKEVINKLSIIIPRVISEFPKESIIGYLPYMDKYTYEETPKRLEEDYFELLDDFVYNLSKNIPKEYITKVWKVFWVPERIFKEYEKKAFVKSFIYLYFKSHLDFQEKRKNVIKTILTKSDFLVEYDYNISIYNIKYIPWALTSEDMPKFLSNFKSYLEDLNLKKLQRVDIELLKMIMNERIEKLASKANKIRTLQNIRNEILSEVYL